MWTRTRWALAVIVAMGCSDGAVTEPTIGTDSGTLAPGESAVPASPRSDESAQVGRLYRLQADFHGALNAGDADAVRALWTDDAAVTAMGSTFTGPDEIVGFFSGSGPFVNGWASLAPAYKTHFEIQGNRATYQFECVYVEDGSNLTGHPVVAHLNATGTMRKVGDRWLFETFVAGAGSL